MKRIILLALISVSINVFCQIRTDKDIKKLISNGVVNTEKIIQDTPHMWNKLANGKEVSLRNGFKNNIILSPLEDSLLLSFDDVIINSSFPKCYFIVMDDKVGICKLDGTIVVPPVNGVPRKIQSVNGLRIGDTYTFADVEKYFKGRLGEKARGAGGNIAALLDEKTLDPIIPYGKYDYIMFTTKGMRQFYYVAKYDGTRYRWGCLNGKGEEILPCLYQSVSLKNGEFIGDDTEDMFDRLNRLRDDINQYNQQMTDSRFAFIERVGGFLSDIGNSIVKLDNSLYESGVYEKIYGIAEPYDYMSINNSGETTSGKYQSQYDSWAHRAERHYNSITNLGSSYSDKKDNKKGSAGKGMSGGNYVAMKRSFREAQRQMGNIRQKALKDGVQIQPSKWETATISY